MRTNNTMLKSRLINCSLMVLLALCALSALAEVDALECPPNETYTDCGANCQTTCATLNLPCNIVHIRCPDGCYCNEGFARDATGRCIPIKECP